MNYDRINLRLLFAVLSFAFTVCLAGNTLKNSEAKNEWSTVSYTHLTLPTILLV